MFEVHMKFGHIEILVTDPQKSKQFYQEALGFELTVDQGGGLYWLQKDQVEILLRPGNPPKSANCYEEAPTGIVLYTDDLETTLQELQQRGLVFRGTVDSEKCYTFTDLDGNWFQLVDPNDH
jgi:catechol 2,3-dioxygenase-like lactoylglutathione lyase family enzyme